ncbi:MAG: DUF99 family protein [Candidatus Micrarchaeota archaeon]
MKPGIRVLGIDDSPFKRSQKNALVVGVVCRKNVVEGVLSTTVSVDGDDATQKLSSMVCRSRFKQQLHAIVMNSIMLAGFNVIDINKFSSTIEIPVLALTRKKPNYLSAEEAVKNVPNSRLKIRRMRSSAPSHRIGSWYVQMAGIDLNEARNIIRIFGNGPSRLAHIIASGIVTGESHGKS